MIKFHRILLLTLVAVFLASAAGIARYAADSCTQSLMYRQLAAQTENFPGDAASTGNNFLPQYQALYAQNSDLAGWIQIDGTNINYPVMQSKHDPDFYLKHNFEKADSPHGCPYVQANCDLQTPSDNILVYVHNMKDGTMFSDLLQYKREFFWEQHRIIQFDTLTAQAEYTVMAVFRGEAEDLFAYYRCTDAYVDMNTMRLMEDRKTRLVLTEKASGKRVFDINLIDYLAMTNAEGKNLSTQEYLDRQSNYHIIFFLSESWLAVQIVVNGWVHRIQEENQ